MGAKGSPSQQRERARRAELQAVQMRAIGYTYEQVADSTLWCTPYHRANPEPGCPACEKMYSSRSAAKRAIDRALEREYAAGADTRESLRRQQLAQIDVLLGPAMRRATGREGDNIEAAVTSCVRLFDRRAKLLGLDAPLRVDRTSELDAQVEALVEQLAAEARLDAAAHTDDAAAVVDP